MLCVKRLNSAVNFCHRVEGFFYLFWHDFTLVRAHMFICLSQTYQILSIFLCAQNAFPVTFFFFLFLKKFLIFKNKYGSGLLKLILIRRIWIRNPDKIPFSEPYFFRGTLRHGFLVQLYCLKKICEMKTIC